MARSKVDHSKSISSTEPIRGIGSVSPGDIILFKYKGKDIYDKNPMVMILYKESKTVHGINLNYLKEFVVGRLLTETNFKNLKWYSLYTKAFRTYTKSNMSFFQRVVYKGTTEDLMDNL